MSGEIGGFPWTERRADFFPIIHSSTEVPEHTRLEVPELAGGQGWRFHARFHPGKLTGGDKGGKADEAD